MPNGTVLAFDFGQRYTGVAVGELALQSFRPLQTIHTTNYQECLLTSRKIIKEWDPVLLIIGLPLNQDGTEQTMTIQCRQFAKDLELATKIKTVLVDERFTSLEADLRLKEKGLNVKDRALAQHAEAAAIILQSYWESAHHE